MLHTIKRLYAEMRTPTIVPGTGNHAIAGLLITADLVVSFSLFFNGHSIAFSHISGFFAAGVLLLLLRLSGLDKSTATTAGRTIFQTTLSVVIYMLVQAALRGGSIASLTHFGLPDSLALGLGILTAVLIGHYSSSLLLSRSSHSSNWLSAGIILIACVFALRLVFFGGTEVIAQEAYYWNYAQHLSPGYLDHPPLVAATIYVGEALFGHNAWGTRFGAIVYGLLFIFIFYRYARLQVEQTAALLACTFALLLPYFFFGAGFLITPDAPLSLAWVMALYFFYRALINNEARAWYGVGLAMGIGMLSKYTIALLAPAALLFILLDAQSRRQLLRKEPYLAVVIALLIFSPVIYWNATHDWASFQFQTSVRFIKIAPQVYLDKMLGNILTIVTPLPLLALPYLFNPRPLRENVSLSSPFTSRRQLFIGSFLLVPMSVFIWNALENEPRHNWTGPLWIALLPMLAWLVVNAGKLRWHGMGRLLRIFTAPLLFTLLGIYAVLLHFISMGLPGVDFPRGAASQLGWPEAARNMLAIQKQLPASAGKVAIIGLDKYFISSKLSYYGTEEFLGKGNKLQVTGNQLMFAYWHPASESKGNTLIMLSRSRSDLSDALLAPRFEKLSPAVQTFPLYKNDFGLSGKTMRDYYYRIGFGYKPPAP